MLKIIARSEQADAMTCKIKEGEAPRKIVHLQKRHKGKRHFSFLLLTKDAQFVIIRRKAMRGRSSTSLSPKESRRLV